MSFKICLSYGSVAVMTPEFAGDALVNMLVSWEDGGAVSEVARRNLFGFTILNNQLTMRIFPDRSVVYRKVKSGAILPKVIIGNAECTLEAIDIQMERKSLPTSASVRAYLLKDGVKNYKSDPLPVDQILSRINLVELMSG
jgi:hypothetical protein